MKLCSTRILSLAISLCATGCNSSSVSVNDPAPASSTAPLFWLEPTTQTLLGTGQMMNIAAALKSSASAPYPSYLAGTNVTWSTSNSAIASIDTNGRITGVSPGSAVITAHYQAYSSQLTVSVTGTMTRRTLSVSGQGTRSYYIYTPSFSSGGAHPLIVSLHGGGGTSQIQAETSLLNSFAQQHQVYVAYPEGSGAVQTFNGGACCGSAKTNNVDDVTFISSVLDDIEANYTIDVNKIYVNGFSNGAIMSHRLACSLANRLAGFAAMSGGSGEFDNGGNRYYTCTPSRPIPIVEFHATNDRNYPIAGGTGSGASGTNFYSIQSTINDWLARNNLTSAYSTENPTSTETCYHYTTTANSGLPSAPFTFCKLDPPDVYDSVNGIVFGGGHSWPGGTRGSSNSEADVPVTDFSSNEYMWRTFGNS